MNARSCLLYGGRSFYYVTGIIASLLINVFEDNSIECERQGRYDKIICKLRKQKKKREYISKKENIDYFIMIKALAKSTHFQ